MNRPQSDHSLRALAFGVLVGCIAAVATVAVLVPLLTRSPDTATADRVAAPAALSTAGDSAANESPDGCTAAQLVAPGEYESVERSHSTLATWVIVPDGYEQMAPASLYVLSIAGFDGSVGELDLVRPAFAALDGVVLVTALDTGDRRFAALVEQVTEDFCVDGERVVTSSVWLPNKPERIEPRPTPPVEPQV